MIKRSPPKLPKVNTIGIKYVQGTITDDHYKIIIEKILGMSGDEVVGIAERMEEKRIILKVSTNERYNQICSDFLGRTLTVEPGCVVRVEDMSSYKDGVPTASYAEDIMPDAIDNGGKSVDQSSRDLEVACTKPGGTIIVWSNIKTDNGMQEFAKWMFEATGVMGSIQEWDAKKFYTYHSLKDLEVALNSKIEYVKTHELRARCTVFFIRVDKDLLARIKDKTENKSLHKKAEVDSGVTIEDVHHIGLGRTIRVHCRTPTGAETIIRNGLLIGGITLRKGKLEELKPIIQCTHCWKIGHKSRNCTLSKAKEPPVCGTCCKTGHRRKDCPTPNDPKCVLCDGKHSSSAGRCLVRKAKIEEAIKVQKEWMTNNSPPAQQNVSIQVGTSVERAIQQSATFSALQRTASQIAEKDSPVLAILANVAATITSSSPFESSSEAGEVLHGAIAAAFRPMFDSFDIVKIIGDTAWRRARGSRRIFVELYKQYLRQNNMPVPNFPDSLLED